MEELSIDMDGEQPVEHSIEPSITSITEAEIDGKTLAQRVLQIVQQKEPDATNQLELALDFLYRFGKLNNKAILYLLSEAYETECLPRGLSLRSWYKNSNLYDPNDDKMPRLVMAVERVIAPLNQEAVRIGEEYFDGDRLIELASPTALMKVSAAFEKATESQQALIVESLAVGNSNWESILERADVRPSVGKIEAVKRIEADGIVVMTLTMTDAQCLYIEKAIGRLLEIHF